MSYIKVYVMFLNVNNLLIEKIASPILYLDSTTMIARFPNCCMRVKMDSCIILVSTSALAIFAYLIST